MTGIYKITNRINGKVYIGQSVNITSRKYDHFCRTREIHGIIDKEIQSVGKENFDFEILLECSREELNDKETYFIHLYNSANPDFGYNIQDTGNQALNCHQGKKVINTKTLEVYNSANQCASALNVSQDSVVRVCNHKHGSVGGYTLMYLDEYEQNGMYEYQNKNTNKCIHKVKCIETGIIYDNCHDAGRKLNLNFRLISSVCTGKRNTTGGYHFCYISE